jgi:hypothetical protein
MEEFITKYTKAFPSFVFHFDCVEPGPPSARVVELGGVKPPQVLGKAIPSLPSSSPLPSATPSPSSALTYSPSPALLPSSSPTLTTLSSSPTIPSPSTVSPSSSPPFALPSTSTSPNPRSTALTASDAPASSFSEQLSARRTFVSLSSRKRLINKVVVVLVGVFGMSRQRGRKGRRRRRKVGRTTV